MPPPLTTRVLLGLVLLHFHHLADGFELGAPLSTCWTRYPKHEGRGTQTTPSPFLITFSNPSYTPGAVITVTIMDPVTKRWFAGIEIAAFRDSGNPEEIVGQFTDFPQDKLQAITCFGGYKNMLTHKNNLKRQRLDLKWTAPAENVGNVTFKATIVANFETFWTGVESKLPAASQNPQLIVAPKYHRIYSSAMVQDIDYSNCGDTKGCFFYPNHCNGDDCIAAVSFEHRPATDDYIFEMHTTEGPNYVSLGFSEDEIMSHDETITCVGISGQLGIQHGWNPHYHNERMLTRFISEAEVRQVDGRLQCRFVLPKKTSIYIINQTAPSLEYTNVTYDREHSWYLFIAWGMVMPESDVITFHTKMPTTSYSKIYLNEPGVYRGSSFHVLVRAHAALMMVAWIFLSGLVTVVSRHYREWMPRTRWFGTKVWFQVHRALAILIAVLTAIGLAVIFAHYGAVIRVQSVPHAYVGLAVTGALGVQLIAGALRPGPDHKMRVFFNWGHRFLGQASHILAAATMFLAYDIEYLTSDMKTFGFAVLGVWVVIQVLWHIIFEVLSCRGMPLSSDEPKADPGQEKASKKSNLQCILLAVYTIFLAGLCVAGLLAFLLF